MKTCLKWLCIIILLFGFFQSGEVVSGDYKVVVHKVEWDATNQAFILRMAVNHGIATAGEHADFRLSITIILKTKEGIDLMAGSVNLILGSIDTWKDAQGHYDLFDESVGWDRAGGTVSGPADVTVLASLINPGGRTIGTGFISDNLIIDPAGDPPETED